MNDFLTLHLDLQDATARRGLERLAAGIGSEQIRRGIGEEVKKFTQARILAGGPAPNGDPWIGLSGLALAFKKGPGLLRESGRLLDSITWQLVGTEEVAIGSAMVYARIHQKGGVIKARNAKALVLPDGSRRTSVKIPARPYLGLSGRERELLERKVARWILRLAGQ